MRYPAELCGPKDVSRCIAEAKNGIALYSDSIIKPQFSEYGLAFPPSWSKILAAAKKEDPNAECPICQKLSAIVDALKCHGRQHVFLFSLIPGNEDYLARFADREYVKGLLAEHGQEAAFDRNICVLKSDPPVLAEVRYWGAGPMPDGLSFKWVETRYFKELVGNTFKAREERSANYFTLNFRDRTAELRLQLLRANPAKRLPAENAIFFRELARYVDPNKFPIIILEPIMKLFISDSLLPITSWRFKSMMGALEGTKLDRAYLSMLKIPLSRFFAHELSVYWDCGQDSTARAQNKLPFAFNGKNNSVTFKSLSDASKVDFILDVVRDINRFTRKYGAIAIRELRELADRYPPDRSLLHMIDYHFDRLNKRELAATELVTEAGYEHDPQAVIEVFQRAAHDFPYKFRILSRGGLTILTMEALFRTIGLLDVLAIRFPKFSARRFGRAAVRASILPLMGIVRLACMSVAKHSAGRVIESSTRIPLIAFELALYALVILMFYSTKRIRRLSIRAIYVVRSALRRTYHSLPPLPRIVKCIRKRLVKLRIIEKGARRPDKPISEGQYLIWLEKLGLTKKN